VVSRTRARELPHLGVDAVEARGLGLAAQRDVGDEVGDRELRLQAVCDVVIHRRPAGDRMHGHVDRRRAAEIGARRRLDRAVAHQAAWPRLDPVLVDRAPVVAVDAWPERGGESVWRVHDVGADRCARARQPRRVHAGSGGHPDLQRLAFRPERRAQAAGLQQRQAHGRVGALLVKAEQRRGRDRCPGGAANRGRVPAALVEPVRARQAPHRLEAGGVAVEGIADAALPVGGDGDGGRRGRRAQVRHARQIRVVEVEHMAGGTQPGDCLEQPASGRTRHACGALRTAAVRAREPVEQRGRVRAHRSAARHTHAISMPCSAGSAGTVWPRPNVFALAESESRQDCRRRPSSGNGSLHFGSSS
jgi:hypothetical protein